MDTAIKRRMGPPLRVSKGTRKVGRLREKAAAALAASKTKKAERFTRKADKRSDKENIKRAKKTGNIGIPYARAKKGTVAM